MGITHSNRNRNREEARPGTTALGRVALVRWSGGIVIGLVLVGTLARLGQGLTGPAPPQSSPTGVSRDTTRLLDSIDRLALVSARGYEDSSGYGHVTGRVTNISDAALQDVTAVVLWYTDWEDFVTTGEGRIDVDPLLPGQTSPFDILGPVNPSASKFSVGFTEASGDSIQTADRR